MCSTHSDSPVVSSVPNYEVVVKADVTSLRSYLGLELKSDCLHLVWLELKFRVETGCSL